MKRRFIVFAGFSGAMAIALGALGAHGLKEKLAEGLITQRSFSAFETAAEYQMYHAIALLAISLLVNVYKNELFYKAGYCFMIGTVLFSGSLYVLSTASLIGLPDMRWLGPITPIGGLFFMTGWVLLGYAGFKTKVPN